MKNDLIPLVKVERRDYPGVAARIRGRARDLSAVEERTREIIARVRRDGDAALQELTLELDRAEIGNILGADDVEAVLAHEPQIWRVLLGLELLRHFLRNQQVLGHESLLAARPDGFVTLGWP